MHRLKELLAAGKPYYREIRALDDVSVSLQKGGRLGIIGENGSGKSTLLKLIAAYVATPTSGTAMVTVVVGTAGARGRVQSGPGGRDNIAQFCMLHGHVRRPDAAGSFPHIIRFSALKDVIG